MEESKKWYHSKTLWVNLVALGASFAQAKAGLALDGPTQGLILAGINILLRIITREKVEW